MFLVSEKKIRLPNNNLNFTSQTILYIKESGEKYLPSVYLEVKEIEVILIFLFCKNVFLHFLQWNSCFLNKMAQQMLSKKKDIRSVKVTLN